MRFYFYFCGGIFHIIFVGGVRLLLDAITIITRIRVQEGIVDGNSDNLRLSREATRGTGADTRFGAGRHD